LVAPQTVWCWMVWWWARDLEGISRRLVSGTAQTFALWDWRKGRKIWWTKLAQLLGGREKN
jgi:hypothetical protein